MSDDNPNLIESEIFMLEKSFLLLNAMVDATDPSKQESKENKECLKLRAGLFNTIAWSLHATITTTICKLHHSDNSQTKGVHVLLSQLRTEKRRELEKKLKTLSSEFTILKNARNKRFSHLDNHDQQYEALKDINIEKFRPFRDIYVEILQEYIIEKEGVTQFLNFNDAECFKEILCALQLHDRYKEDIELIKHIQRYSECDCNNCDTSFFENRLQHLKY